MIELSINFALPTLNEYTARNRVKKGRFSLGNVIKKQTENKIMLHARAQKLKLPNTKLYVVIFWLNYNRNDNDNVEFAQKFIFDALQKGGFLKNDSKKEIGQPKVHFHMKNKERAGKHCKVIFFENRDEFKRFINKNI